MSTSGNPSLLGSSPLSLLDTASASHDRGALHIEGGAGQLGAYTLCRISSILKKPVFFLIEQVIRSSWVPVMPGEFGQRSAAVEYAYRGSVVAVAAALGAVILASPAVYTLTALAAFGGSGVLAIGLKLAASYLNPSDFFSMAEGELKPLERNKLCVVSANICAFEAGLNWPCGGMRSWKDRLEGIVEAFTQSKDQAPDIIALQEVWSQEVALSLIEELRKKGYKQFFFNIGIRPHAPGSGLFVASRTKISNPEFTPFEDGRVFDMKRGFFKGEVERNSGESITFVTTHLEPSKDDFNPTQADKNERKAQFLQIQNSIEGKKAIICGDLNMGPEELQTLGSGASGQSLFAGNTEPPTCAPGFDTQLKGHPESREIRLDYILATTVSREMSERADGIMALYSKKENGNGAENSTLDTNQALSDHQGITTTFTLS